MLTINLSKRDGGIVVSRPIQILIDLDRRVGSKEIYLEDLYKFFERDLENLESELLYLVENGFIEAVSTSPLRIRISAKGRRIVRLVDLLVRQRQI